MRAVVPGMLIATMLGAATASAANERTRVRRRAETAVERPTEVFGRVTDRHGRGIAGVSVIATPVTMPRPLGRAVVTDHLGRFRLVGLPPGDYWFLGIHGEYPFGMTPAMPVADRLEVAITLDLETLTI